MRLYHFETLIGTVYRKGNVAFLADSDTLLSPVGNRISRFNLKANEVKTLSVDGSHNYTSIDVSPNGLLLVAGNEIGEVHVISLVSLKLLNCLKIGKAPSIIKFSPDGKLIAIGKEQNVQVYSAPDEKKLVNACSLERVISCTMDVTTIDWSFDSKLIVIGAKDMMVRIHALERYKHFTPALLGSHTDSIVHVFFANNTYDFYSMSRNRQLVEWTCDHEPEEWVVIDKNIKNEDGSKDGARKANELLPDVSSRDRSCRKRKATTGIFELPKATIEETKILFLGKNTRYLYGFDTTDNTKRVGRRVQLTSADYNKLTRVIVTGYSDGVFIVLGLPDYEQIQSLNITEHRISTVRFNQRGDWIAFGSPTLGQLLVWEFASETNVLKEQGHFDTMMVCAFSSDGRNIVTGGLDGKVKVWETRSSRCFITFVEHVSNITGVVFTQNGRAILSSSADGTIRAFDLVRYRNFRTFTSPQPAQFSCVTVDASGELVAAGATDVFEIFLWSMKSGDLLEKFGGHEGPVTSVLFSPAIGSSQLASVSLDKTFRTWETVENSGAREISQLNSEGTCLAFRPDGEEIAVGTLDCHILIFKLNTYVQRSTIEGRNHLGAGVSDTDIITANKNLSAISFTSLSYSPDGLYLLAAGESKSICYYDADRGLLLKKYIITQNKSLDGMNEFVHHRNLTEFGNKNLVDDGENENNQPSLPGVRMGDMSSRSVKPKVRVTDVCFSPTGMQWIGTSTEGLFVYSHENWRMFLPISADENVTPASINTALHEEAYDKALILSLQLNMEQKTRQVMERIPVTHIEAICTAVPPAFWEPFLRFLAHEIGISRHLQFFFNWAQTFLRLHLKELKSLNACLLSPYNLLEKNMADKQKDLLGFCNNNKYSIEYLLQSGPASRPSTSTSAMEAEEIDTKPNLTAQPNRSTDTAIECDSSSDDDEELFLMRAE